MKIKEQSRRSTRSHNIYYYLAKKGKIRFYLIELGNTNFTFFGDAKSLSGYVRIKVAHDWIKWQVWRWHWFNFVKIKISWQTHLLTILKVSTWANKFPDWSPEITLFLFLAKDSTAWILRIICSWVLFWAKPFYNFISASPSSLIASAIFGATSCCALAIVVVL